MAASCRTRPRRARGVRTAWRIVVAMALLGALLVVAPATGSSGEPVPVGVWPLRPRPAVIRGFQPPADPFGPGHRGVDLAGAPGQAVLAALTGAVTFAGRLAGRGVVVVDHGATRTTYEPVAARVRVGEVVAAGDRIGVLELPGSHCFPAACLHWGLLRGDVYLDPLGLVDSRPVRLLPLHSASGPVPAFRVPGAVRLPYADWHPLIRVVLAVAAALPRPRAP